MSRLVLWKVTTAALRNAIDVQEPEVGNYCLVLTDGVLYKAIKAGAGATSWESAVALQDLVDDTTPQLGGDLDVNANGIVSTSNGNIDMTPHGTGGVTVGSSPIGGKAEVALTDGANIATDCTLGNVFGVTLAGNRTFDNPSGMVVGLTYVWKITQDGTGSRLGTFGTKFHFAGGAPTLTTTAAAVDVVIGTYDGTNFMCRIEKAVATS